MKKSTRPEADDAYEALMGRIEELRRSDPDAALAAATKALGLAEAAGNRAWLARSLVVVGHLNYVRAEYAVAADLFKRALEIARADRMRLEECHALLGLGFIAHSKGRSVEATRELSAALMIAREIGDRSSEGYAHNTLGNVFRTVGDSGAAIGEFERALEIFVASGERLGEFFVRNNFGVTCLALSDGEGALEQLSCALEIAEEIGNQHGQISALVNVGNALERLGRFEEALEYYQRSLVGCRQASAPSLEAYVLVSMGSAELSRGDGGAALAWFDRAQSLAASIGDAMQWTALGVSAEALQLLGRHADAIEALLEALGHTDSDGDSTYVPSYHELLAHSYEELDDSVAALRHRRLGRDTRERLAGIEKQRKIVQVRMREQMAEAMAELGRLERDAASLESRVATATEDLTEVHSTIERRDAFIAALRAQIDEVAAELGSSSAEKVQAISGRLRRRLDDDRSWQGFTAGFETVHPGFLRVLATRWPALTRMEIRVCVLMRLELSTKEMAELLFASPRTIHGHRFNVRRKLGLARDDDLGDVLKAAERT